MSQDHASLSYVTGLAIKAVVLLDAIKKTSPLKKTGEYVYHFIVGHRIELLCRK